MDGRLPLVKQDAADIGALSAQPIKSHPNYSITLINQSKSLIEYIAKNN